MAEQKQKAFLIDLVSPRTSKEQALGRLEELEELVNTFGGLVIVKQWQKRFSPHAKTYLGTGKVEQLGQEAKELGATIVIINAQLKPRQIYEINEELRPHGIVAWDRVDLILKIFAKHAKTTEARLEIELASIHHMGPRIFGMGMELSRQGGGIGGVGVGQTNTERMKRHLKEKQRRLKEKLEQYERGRTLQREGRRRRNLKSVALVGYTNAGKTSLLNALTGSKEYVANALFATLDTRIGQLFLPAKRESALVSDTIGFIKELPPELIKAFTSTLSETIEADLLLHVIDGADQNVLDHIDVVDDILERIESDKIPRLLVINKIDSMSDRVKARLARELEEKKVVWISVKDRLGIDELITEIENTLG